VSTKGISESCIKAFRWYVCTTAGGFLAGLNPAPIQLNSMTMTQTKQYDVNSVTFHGRIAHMELAEHQGDQFLVVTLAHTMSPTTEVRVKFTNSNGLLTAYNNGTVMIGQELTVIGNLKGFRAFYMKDDCLVPLKYPEIQLRCTAYIFGSKPKPKEEVPFSAEPTLEEVPF
jgi:hypothetical protein